MAKVKLISGIVVALIAIILIFIGFFYLFNPSTEKSQPPDAMIEVKKSNSGNIIINQGDTIFFSAINSSDSDGEIEKYHWNFDDGGSSKDVDPVHKFDEPGTYNVSLTVEDNDGNKDVTWIIITVNNNPIANANFEDFPEETFIKIPIYDWVQFNSNGTSDDESEIDELSYLWDFGNGNNSTMANPRHQFSSIGTFIVKLTVFDPYGSYASDSLEVQVILRTYKISWNLNQKEETIGSNKYTREGETSEILRQLQQEQLSRVNITLNWTDLQPLLKNNQSKGEDQFELDVLTPENISKIQNSTSGNISIIIEYRQSITTQSYNAKTKNEAISFAYKDIEFGDEGRGEWKFNVSAVECKGGNWQNDQFDLDIGNFWDLKVILFYFEYELTEITYDNLE